MAIIKCRECGASVSSEAKMCPQCGAQPKKSSSKFWTYFAGLILLGALLSALRPAGKVESPKAVPPSGLPITQPEHVQEKPKMPPVKPVEHSISIDAISLLKDYEANELMADNRYKGRMVEVTGIVDGIKNDILDNPFVTLKTQNVILDVQCLFAKGSEQTLMRLQKGTQITIVGRIRGKFGNVIIEKCSLR